MQNGLILKKIRLNTADKALFVVKYAAAGLPALQSSQPGQMRKQAATTIEQVPGVRFATHFPFTSIGAIFTSICFVIS